MKKTGAGPETRPQLEEAVADAITAPSAPEITPQVEAAIRGAGDLGHAAALLREHHPSLDQRQRLDAIKEVTTRVLRERDKPNARRDAIARMARQHQGESHREHE